MSSPEFPRLTVPDQLVTINEKEYQLELSTIESTMLGVEDHGIFTFMLHLNYFSGGIQGGGGYSLDGYNKETKKRDGTMPKATLLLRDIITICGVSSWEKLKGAKVYAIKEKGWSGYVRGLANLSKDYLLFEDYTK